MQSQLTKSASRAYGLIEADLRQVSSLIDKQIASTNPALEDILTYIRGYRGKMLRPALVLMAGKCCGKTAPLHLQIAAIVELIHTATLLHDDVIDESHQRRGRKTVNDIYGNEAAVMAGDFVFSRVFHLCAELPDRRIAGTLADTCIRICQGELEQNFNRRNQQLSEADYIRIITEKSASFLSSCCYLGAYAAGAAPALTSALADFGLNIGIVFQIIDDVLDIDGDEHVMGKQTGSDFDKEKFTLPMIHLLSKTDLGTDFKYALLKQHGCLDYARARAAEFHKIAIESLGVLEQTEAKIALIETADFCLIRAG